jgi:trigger factor
MDPNQFAQAIDSQGQIGSMVQEVARRKALAAVLEQATVTDTSGNAVDLNALVPEAEDAEADGATGAAAEAVEDVVEETDAKA